MEKQTYFGPLKTGILIAILCTSVQCKREHSALTDGFELHPEFQIELVAAEPLLFDPVDMKFDEQGRTYVLEMPGYPLRDEESRIIELIDKDHNGVYDQRLLYADKLGVASSFMPYKGGFLVASPPYLLWIADSNLDGTADKREILLDGFSNDNLQHNFNGLSYGLDNWIYAANGGNSGKPYFLNKKGQALDLRGGDLRINLNDQKLVRAGESSGGFQITFDEWGRLFETHNLEHTSQLVFEDRYLDGVPGQPMHALVNISDHEENGLSRIYPFGEQENRVNHPEQSGYFSGACGITYYGGGAFPPGFEPGLLVADCVLNLVHFDQLHYNGSAATTTRMREKVEFLASKDRAFRPVNMCVGPDGALYVIDMYRVVIEHPEWIPDELENKMDLQGGKEKGRIYRITPKDQMSFIPPAPDFSSVQACVEALASPNQWRRTTAQRLLVTGELKPAVPLILDKWRHLENPQFRLHSLWTLEGLSALPDSLLLISLGDSVPGIRENAIKIAETRLVENAKWVPPVLSLCSDPDPRVRMQAALALSTLDGNLYKEYAGKIADILAEVLREQGSDIWIVRAITAAVSPQPLAFLDKLVKNVPVSNSTLLVMDALAEGLGWNRSAIELAEFLDLLIANPREELPRERLLASCNRGLAEHSTDTGMAHFTGHLGRQIEKLEIGAEADILYATAQMRQYLGLPRSKRIKGMMQLAAREVYNEEKEPEYRSDQLALLAFDMITSKMPLALQREALRQLWEANDPEIAGRLLSRWKELGPEARKHSTDILLYKAPHHNALLTAMENGMVGLGEFNLDLERRRVLLFSDSPEIRGRAQKLFSDAGVVQRKEVLKAYSKSLSMEGDPGKGRILFRNNCASCHRYEELGEDVGPVLTEISRKSKASILHDILDPNAAVDTRYLSHTLTDRNGTIYTGMVFLETDAEVGIRMTGGEEKVFHKSQIQSFSANGHSMMPEGLEQGISPGGMADLLSFLQVGSR